MTRILAFPDGRKWWEPLVRSIVEALQPTLMITGHYHQDFGREDRLGPIRLVNPGPAGTLVEF